MKRWHVATPLSGHFSPRINYGGRPFWCAFDYRVICDPAVDSLVVDTPQDADAPTLAWVPHLREGMEICWQELVATGLQLTGICVTIEHISVHPIDTTPQGCRYYGAAFLSWICRNYAISLDSTARS